MFRLGEPVFRSIQGEGNRTGVLSIWVRMFGCNLTCAGFYQPDPTNQKTWSIPAVLDCGKAYKTLKDVPIITTGCDSGYSWSKNFKHLVTKRTTDEVLADVMGLTYDGTWTHPKTQNEIDICFTGGEPMMQQDKIVSLIEKMAFNHPKIIQIETNATKPLLDGFGSFFSYRDTQINWNISPKLHNVSGENDAVNYKVIHEYVAMSQLGCIKFVVNDRDATWAELDNHVAELKKLRIKLPIYVMPVGASYEQQTDTKTLSSIANRAIERGYHVSGRLQCTLFGNNIGT